MHLPHIKAHIGMRHDVINSVEMASIPRVTTLDVFFVHSFLLLFLDKWDVHLYILNLFLYEKREYSKNTKPNSRNGIGLFLTEI